MKYDIECTKFTSCKRGFLQGFFNLYVGEWDLEISNFTFYSKEGKRWIKFPTRPFLIEDGSRTYPPYFKFKEKKKMDQFSKEAKQSVYEWIENNSGNEKESTEYNFVEKDRRYGQ